MPSEIPSLEYSKLASEEQYELALREIRRQQEHLSTGHSTDNQKRQRVLQLCRMVGSWAWDFHGAELGLRHYEDGIEIGHGFLEQGETDPGVREAILDLYLIAGVCLRDNQRRAKAHDFFQCGIDLGHGLLEQGETDPRVRALILELYSNACAKDNGALSWAEELALFQSGIALGYLFLEQGETDPRVRKAILKLHVNAGAIVPINSGAKDGEALGGAEVVAFFQRGIDLGYHFLEQGETDPEVRDNILLLHHNAGLAAEDGAHDRLQAHTFFQQGIAFGHHFLEQGETDPRVREHILTLHLSAGNTNREFNFSTKGLGVYQDGIGLGHRFLAQGEADSGVREAILGLYFNADIKNEESGNGESALAQRLAAFYLGFGLGAVEGITQRSLPFRTESFRSEVLPYQLPPAWRRFLRVLLLEQHGLDLNHVAPPMRRALLDQALGLALLLRAEQLNVLDNMTERLMRPTPPAKALSLTAREFWPHWRTDPTPPCWGEMLLIEIRKGLRKPLGWLRQPYLHWRTWQHLRQVDAARDAALAAIHPDPTPAIARWLTSGFAVSLDATRPLSDPGRVLLGRLYAEHRREAEPEPLVQDWESHPPWQGDGSHLMSVWEPTGYEDWITPTQRPALYSWLLKAPPHARLKYDFALGNSDAPAVAEPLLALAKGHAEILARTLEAAWVQARTEARHLEAWMLELRDILARRNPDPGEYLSDWTPPASTTVLDAVLRGQGRSLLQSALAAALEIVEPARSGGADRFVLRRRFGRALTLYPTPAMDPPLVDRIQAWGQQVLTDALHAGDTEQVWSVLEAARIALLGLHREAPDEDWEQETAQALYPSISASLDEHQPGALWPPLALWQKAVDQQLRPYADAAVAGCRSRLPSGEAIAQIFFDPQQDQSWLLWLDGRGAGPQVWPLPDACAHSAWRGDQGILDRWEDWLTLRRREPTSAERQFELLWNEVQSHPAVHGLITRVREQAEHASVQRVSLFLPGALGQLPWEALAGDAWPAGLVERGATLSRWRNGPKRAGAVEDPPLVIYDSDPQSVLYGQVQAERLAALRNADLWPSCADLTSADLLHALQSGRDLQLILHGDYQPDDPYHSGFSVAPNEFLPLWAACAQPLPGPVLNLSVCMAGLSGATAVEALGPVGIAPALVAAGARRVTAPLWSVHSLAAWCFFELDHELALAQPQLSPQARLAQTQNAMRHLRRDELEARLRSALGNARFDRDRTNLPLLQRSYPFGNPVHWAAFATFGEA